VLVLDFGFGFGFWLLAFGFLGFWILDFGFNWILDLTSDLHIVDTRRTLR
jgi:hypothetical protein